MHLVLSLALLGSSVPALAGDPAVELAMKPTVKVLPNGLTVILEESHRTDKVALHLTYGVGSRDERPGEYGCAHLFEHLMFEGSEHVPTNKFDEWLTGAGGDNNAYTSEDVTAYHMAFPNGATDLALFLESDRMGYLLSGVNLENVANQRKIVLQERAEGYAEPNGRDWDALSRLLWPADHPYHHPVIGTVADVAGFTVDGTQDFWKRHYRPQNAVLAVVGDFETAAAMAQIEAWFTDVPDPGKPEPRVEKARTDAWPGANGYLEDDVEERSVYVAWPTVPAGHPDEPALELLSYILSNGRGTRLDDRLYYDSKLATSVFAYSSPGDIEGFFLVAASSPKTKIEKLADVMNQEIHYIPQGLPTTEELDRAKEAVRSGWLDALENLEGRAELLVDCQRTVGRPDCLVDEWKRFAAVQPADISRVVKTYFVPERQVTLSVVPRGDLGMVEGSKPVELP